MNFVSCLRWPKVALYNIDEDPTESINLAYERPELVETLLTEAEEIIKDAPPLFIGDINDR